MRKSIAIVITTILFLSNLAPAMAVSIGNEIDYVPLKLGVGTTDPQAKLDVAGDAIIRGSLSIIDSTEAAGKVLTSDQFGNATWTDSATTVTGLDYSNFVAAMTLDEDTTINLASHNLNYGPDLFVLNADLSNIGIGTNDPSGAKLQVVGDVKADNFLIGNVGLGFANSRLELTGGDFGLAGSLSAGNIGIGVNVPSTALQVGAPAAGAAINLAGSDGVYIANNLEVDGKIYGDGSEITSLNPTNFSGPITAESATTANAAKTLVSPDGSITVATTTDAGGIDFTLADSFVVTKTGTGEIFKVVNDTGDSILTVNHDKVLIDGLSIDGILSANIINVTDGLISILSTDPSTPSGFVGNGSRLTNLKAQSLVTPDGVTPLLTTFASAVTTVDPYKSSEFLATTITAVSPTTIAEAATVLISGAPNAGTGVTLTKAYALKVDGDTLIDGKLSFGPAASIDTTNLDLSGFEAGSLASDVTITNPTFTGTILFDTDAVLSFTDTTVINDFTVNGAIESTLITADTITANVGFEGDGSLITNVAAETLVSPDGLLTVASASNIGKLTVTNSIFLTSLPGATSPEFILVNPDNDAESVFTARDGDAFTFEYGKTVNDDRLVAIMRDGNVGIGTFGSTIDQKLVVAGNVKATQFIGDGSQLTGVLATGFVANTTLVGLVVDSILSGEVINANLISILPGPSNGFEGDGSRITNINPANIVGLSLNDLSDAKVTSAGLEQSIYIGEEAGQDATGEGNTSLGKGTLLNVRGSTNVAVGAYAGNLIQGDLSGRGSANVLLGAGAGSLITTGSSNIIIGHNVQAADPIADNQINIGNAIYGKDGKVGIGIDSPEAKLHVAGELLIGNSSVACNSTNKGSIRFNATSNKVELCNGSIWKNIGQDKEHILLADERSNGVVGGSCVANTWTTRTLNKIINNESGTDVSISANKVTLPAGKYECSVDAEVYNTRTTQSRIFNVTDNSLLSLGKSVRSDYYATANSSIKSSFTLSTSKELRVDTMCERNWSTQDFGTPSTFNAGAEKYLYMECYRTPLVDVPPPPPPPTPVGFNASCASDGVLTTSPAFIGDPGHGRGFGSGPYSLDWNPCINQRHRDGHHSSTHTYIFEPDPAISTPVTLRIQRDRAGKSSGQGVTVYFATREGTALSEAKITWSGSKLNELATGAGMPGGRLDYVVECSYNKSSDSYGCSWHTEPSTL